MRRDNLYHLTSSDKLEAILRFGLLPNVGDNSSMVGDKDRLIYLSPYDSIPFWRILLDKSIVIEIETHSADIASKSYNIYEEYFIDKPIPVTDLVSIFTMPSIDYEVMRTLCLKFIYDISHTVRVIIKSYYMHEFDSEYIVLMLTSFMNTLNRLDFNCITDTEKSAELIELGESGDYTFLDAYLNTPRKLYEQMLYIKDDRTHDLRKQFYDFITDNFKNSLHLDTGGWTG